MVFVAGPVSVSVPATSANLGPGFDCLGLALDLRDTLTAEVYDGPLEITVAGEGAGEVPLDSGHLVVRAMSAAFEVLGEEPPGLRLTCINRIPHARGLGSSSAAIVAGIVLARALLEEGADRLDDGAALDLANRLEGHPDNVAPALLGGFTVATQDAGHVAVARLDVDRRIGAVLFVPPDPVETAVARGLLPEVVRHARRGGELRPDGPAGGRDGGRARPADGRDRRPAAPGVPTPGDAGDARAGRVAAGRPDRCRGLRGRADRAGAGAGGGRRGDRPSYAARAG